MAGFVAGSLLLPVKAVVGPSSFGGVGAAAQGAGKGAGSVFTRGFKMAAGVGIAAVGATIVGAISAGGKFEKSMNQVAAVSGATGKKFDQLRDQAKELGRTTKFSATESADAMGFLAMAGFNTDQILKAMPATLELAAAGNMDLARAADIASNVLTGYGMEAKDLGKANDVLAKTFTSTNTDLSQLGEAFKYAGPVAKSAGLQFEDTAAAIGLMGNAGIQGSMAGTSLRGAITKLLNPSAAASKTLRELGLNAVDSEGNLKPLDKIVGQLAKSGATTGEMMEIFGQRAGPAMAALVGQGAGSLRKLRGELKSSGGTAKAIADKQMEGLSGALTKLKSASEGFLISVSDTGILDIATKAVAGLTEGVAWATERMDGASGAITKFFDGLSGGGGAVRGLTDEVMNIGRQLLDVAGPAFAMIGDKISGELLPAFRDMLPTIAPIAKFLIKVIGGAVVGAFKGAVRVVRGVIDILTGIFKTVRAVLTGDWKAAWAGVKQILGGALNAIVGAIQVWFNLGILAIFRQGFKALLRSFSGAWNGIRGIVGKGMALTQKIVMGFIKFLAKRVFPVLRFLLSKVVVPVFKGVGKAVGFYVTRVVVPVLKGLWTFFRKVLFPVLRFLWKNVVVPVFKGIGAVIKTWWSRIVKPVFGLLRAYFTKVLFPVIRFLWSKVVKPVFSGIGKTIKGAWNHVIKPIFQKLGSFIKDTVAPAFRKGVGAIGKAWAGIKALAKKPVNFVIDTVYNKGIRKAFNWIADKIGASFSLPSVSKVGGGGGGAAKSGEHMGLAGVGGAGSHLPHAVSTRSSGPNLADMEATGGPFGWLKNITGKAWKWVKGKFDDTVGKRLSGLADNPFAKMIGRMGKNLAGSLIAKIKNLFIKSDQSKASQQAAKNVKGTKGNVLPRGAYSIGMPYLGYPGHYGADYPATTGTPVRSMAPGIVSKAASLTTSYGKHAYVDHPGGIQTRYAHLNSLNVGAGSKVGKGARLGSVGSTGNSTGPHLHFEYRKNGSPVNPASLGIFDRGGKLDPGMLAYHSRSIRKPDNVLTDQQFRDMHTLAQRGADNGGGAAPTIVQNFPTSSTPEAAAASAGGRTSAVLSARGR